MHRKDRIVNQNQGRQGSLELLKSEGLETKGQPGQGQESKAADAANPASAGKPSEQPGPAAQSATKATQSGSAGKPGEKISLTNVFKRNRLSVLAKPSCPNCASDRCPASKGADETPSAVIRYRRCSKCGHSFKTVAAVKDGMVGPERVSKS